MSFNDLFSHLDLNFTWFILVGILLTGYAILDGFDLGVGILHLFTNTDTERRIMLNSIGPVWDGNEVWLVTGGGALFAAFPDVYATAFSAFYLPFMLLLFMLIFRAVAIEFRSKEEWLWWRTMWDIGFCLSCLFASFLMGVAVGNVAYGIPLNSQGEYAGHWYQLLHPYALLVGITTVALFAMHGSIYVLMKTESELHDKIKSWIKNTIAFFSISYVLTTMATLLYVPQMTDRVRAQPLFFVIAVLNALAIANIPREIYYGRHFNAFISSCFNIVFLMVLFALGVFPYLLPSNPYFERGLSLYNASSSQGTLGIMLIIALLTIPLVLSYTISVYWIFRGKVTLNRKSY